MPSQLIRPLLLSVLAGAAALAAPPPASFQLNPPQLPPATVGKSYTGGPLVVMGGGQCPRNYTSVRLAAGSLPPGMMLSPAGEFAGAPLEAGRFEFVVRVENGCGWSDQALALEVNGAPILLANPAGLQFRVLPGQAVAPAVVQVSGNIPGAAYSVSSPTPWIRARARSGRIPAAASAFAADLVEVEIDSAGLAPGSYRGQIELGAWRSGSGTAIPVEVEVLTAAGAPASVRAWSAPVQAEENAGVPRIVVPSFTQSAVEHAAAPPQPAAAHDGHGAAHPAPAAHTARAEAHAAPASRQPAASPKRMSRSAQLRSKYLSAKAHAPAPAAAAHAPAAHAPAPKAAAPDPHAKPSPVGEAKHGAAPAAKKDDHGAPAKKDAHGAAPAAKKDDHGGAKKDDHGTKTVAQAKDSHAAPKDDHKSKPKEEHKEKPKH